MVRKAEELCEKHGWFLCHQFENEANWKFHELTTGPEILADFKGKKLDYWVTGYGTGGAFHGAGKALKAALPDLKIILGEPEPAGLLKSGTEQTRNADGSPAESHPAFAPHPIQGGRPTSSRRCSRTRRARCRRAAADPARRRDRGGEGPRVEGGPPHRHLGQRHDVGGAADGEEGAEGLGDPRDAPRPGEATSRRRSSPTSRPT